MKQEVIMIHNADGTKLSKQIQTFIDEGYQICSMVEIGSGAVSLNHKAYLVIIEKKKDPSYVLFNGVLLPYSDFIGKTISELDKVSYLYE